MAGRKDRKAELIAELARARAGLERATAHVRDDADIPRRIRRNVAKNMFVWLGGAALVGVIIAKLPRRTKKVLVDAEGHRVAKGRIAKTGLLFAAAKVAFDLARPTLMRMATERLEPFFRQHMQHEQSDE